MEADSHGNSMAAWVGVTVMLIATVVGCWGVFAGPIELLYVGLGGFLVGALLWYGLDRAGFGGAKSQPAASEPAEARRS